MEKEKEILRKEKRKLCKGAGTRLSRQDIIANSLG
jgi:hypothetical protein